MSEATLQETALQDRVPVFQKIIYGLGSLANNLCAAALGCMVIVLNLGLKMDPAKIGLILALSKLTDAFLDPIMGYVSDHTTFKWGRRRPYIVVGAIISGIIFALMWQLPAGHSQRFYFWFFLLGTNLFYVAYTLYAAPYIGLGYEMTADYHERTRIQGYANFIGQIAWMLVPWFWAIMSNKNLFSDSVAGARGLAIGVGATVIILGVLPGIFCKEPFYSIAMKEGEKDLQKTQEFVAGLWHHVSSFFAGFWTTLKNRRFLKLAAATFLVFNGFMIIAGLGSYTIIFFLFGGDQGMGSKYMGLFGTVSSLCTFCEIPFVAWVASKVGKKKAFMLSTSLAILGYLIKWPCYKVGMPNLIFLPAPLIGFGFAGLFTTVAAMIADVCDQDELENGRRREATFGAIYWWMLKLGMAVALALSGYLLNFTGFLVELGGNQSPRTLVLLRLYEIGVPILTYALAIVAVATYDLTQEKAQEIRLELEKRRGKAVS
jgi:glycoside/pentoside/hexuronide:cation symporter, GPH family